MAQKVYILGGLQEDYDREELLRKLNHRTGEAVIWEWVKAIAKDGWRPPAPVFNRMLAELQKKKPPEIRVVLLRCIHKSTKGYLLQYHRDPVLAPDCKTGDALVEWLVSPEANLVPGLPWYAETREAAFWCIVAKLLKNKSWAKDTHGHKWTREADLLGQAPVNLPDRPEVRRAAGTLLEKMESILLLTKGANYGRTKKEWAIFTEFLPVIKKAFLAHSLDLLESKVALAPLLAYLRSGKAQQYRLDDVIQENRVRYVCKEPERQAEELAPGQTRDQVR